jgi:hypothetical protein
MPACPADASIDLPLARRSSGGDYLPQRHELMAPERSLRRVPAPLGWIADRLNFCQRMIFPGLWLFIGLVSAFDTYLTVKFQDSLEIEELNPLARMLLQLDGWDPALFIGVKFLGSVMVLGILAALHLSDRRIGLVIATAIASFQLGLLGYLVLG